MSRNREVKDKTRNNIFAAALDYLKRNSEDISTQMGLAKKMGVSKDTITNIIKYRTDVTEDIITKLQTATGCVFNLQWLRGESNVMLAADLQQVEPISAPDRPTMLRFNSLIAAKDETIAEKDGRIEDLRKQLADKEETMKRELADKDKIIETKEKYIALLEQQLGELRGEKGLSGGYPFVPGVADQEHRCQQD